MTSLSRHRRSRRVIPWTAVMDCLILLLWGLMLVRFWTTGLLALLLHPDYMWLSNSAAVLLVCMGGIRGWQILQRVLHPERRVPALEGHINLLPRQISGGLLLAVAVFGLLYTPRPFTSETALQRGIAESLGQTRSQPQRFVRATPPEERTIIDWVRTLNVYPEPDAYAGQPVSVTGFVIHPPDWPSDYFMISRFVLTCCAADAYPVGLPVHLEANQPRPETDTWLAVEGEIQTAMLNDQRQLTIRPSRLETIPEPKNPYEY